MTTDHDELPSSSRTSTTTRQTAPTTPPQKRELESDTEAAEDVTLRDLIIISIGKLNSGFLQT